MRLRLKVLSGFLVLALMLSLAGAWSIYELRSISTTVQDLLKDNYESIHAGKSMLESLEREDSAVLLLLLGRWDEGRAILASADSLFQSQWQVVANNITVEGEAAAVQGIEASYQRYKDIWKKPIVDTQRQGDLGWYFESTHRAFLDAKVSVNALIDLNNRAMYRTASDLRNRADRAVMPGIVAIGAALVFSLLFSYFVNIYMVNPIVRITEAIGRFLGQQDSYDLRIDTGDELSELADSIRTLISRSAGRGSSTQP